MENVYGNFNYNAEFIEDLQSQVSNKIAKLSSKKNSYRKFDIRDAYDVNDLLKLQNYNQILTEIRYCNDCFKDYNINDVVSKIKNLLNNL